MAQSKLRCWGFQSWFRNSSRSLVCANLDGEGFHSFSKAYGDLRFLTNEILIFPNVIVQIVELCGVLHRSLCRLAFFGLLLGSAAGEPIFPFANTYALNRSSPHVIDGLMGRFSIGMTDEERPNIFAIDVGGRFQFPARQSH